MQARAKKTRDGTATHKKRLTVLFVHPGAELYGSDRVLLESVTALTAHGHRVVVALPSRGPLVGHLRQAGAEVRILETLVLRKDYLRFRRIPALAWNTIRGSLMALRALRLVNPDVVYVNTITLPLWPPLARVRRIPVLTHVHEGETSSTKLVRRLLYLPHRASTAVIFNSEFSRTVVATVHPRLAARGRVIYNGVAGPEQPKEPRVDLGGTLKVLYLGRLSPRKGPDLIIDAARVLAAQGTTIQVGMLGSSFVGYEWYEDQLRSSVRDAHLTKNVIFHGFHDVIWPFLEESDVLVVPSRLDEGFGNTAVESVLATRPVIASDTSGLREATAGFCSATLVPADDVNALAGALAETISDWPMRRQLAIVDAERARTRFSPARYRGDIVREIEKLAKSL